jgi:ArsR family transcriptional regulator
MDQPPLDPTDFEFAAAMLRMAGHPVRLRIVEILQQLGEVPVNQLQDQLRLAQPAVSQHLNKMKALGLLRAQRRGGMVYYSVAKPQLFRLLDCIRGCKRPA